METITCSVCGNEKAQRDFRSDQRTSSGLKSSCRNCEVQQRVELGKLHKESNATIRCSRCVQEKTADAFGHDIRRISGLKSICKPCEVIVSEEYRKRHRDDPSFIEGQLRSISTKLQVYAKKRERGECCICSTPAIPGTSRCEKHVTYAKEHYGKARARRRQRVITAYGGKCSCCGETNFLFLTLDHINNDGAHHRRKIGRGDAIYVWAEREDFPSSLQVLCSNCNWGKRMNGGICPHKEKRA